MTIKEIAGLAGVTGQTVRNTVKKIFPELLENGKETLLKRHEAVAIMAAIRKKADIQPTKTFEVPTKTFEASKIDRLENMVENLCKAVMAMLPAIQQTKQLEIIQDYFSIRGYASKTGQQVTFSDALQLGRCAGRLSREQEKEIRQVDDERWGRVNSYHIDILKIVFAV